MTVAAHKVTIYAMGLAKLTLVTNLAFHKLVIKQILKRSFTNQTFVSH